jgi:hypothetical protein
MRTTAKVNHTRINLLEEFQRMLRDPAPLLGIQLPGESRQLGEERFDVRRARVVFVDHS